MKKTSGLLWLFVWLSFGLVSQDYENWYTYGDVGDDVANSIVQTSDGGFLVAGYTRDAANQSSAVVLRYSTNFSTPVAYKFEGEGVNTVALDVIELPDFEGNSGFLFVGSYGNGTARQMWAVRCNTTGGIMWENTYGDGSLGSIFQWGEGFAVGGSKIMILNGSNGLVSWEYPLTCQDLKPTSDGDIIALGEVLYESMMLTKIKPNVGLMWEKSFGPAWFVYPSSVEQTAEGYILAATGNYDIDDNLQGIVIGTDGSGNELWRAGYQGPYALQLFDAKQTADGGYILAGDISVEDLSVNIYADRLWVTKTDAYGTEQWNYQVECDDRNFANALAITDNGYAFAGNTRIDGDVTDCSTVNDLDNTEMGLFFLPTDDLTAWFTATPRLVAIGDEVTYTDGSLGNPSGWTWTLPNAVYVSPSQQTSQNVTVTYESNGIYNSTLSVTNGSLTDELTRSNYVYVYSPYTGSYNTPSGNAESNWIKIVQLGQQTNDSEWSVAGYEDFTSDFEFNLEAGNSYGITLDPGSKPGKKVPKNWRVWIDYDLNGGFYEVFASDGEKGTVTGSFDVPSNVYGKTRLRVGMRTDGTPSPGDTGYEGEFEDYTVIINPALPQPPVAEFEANTNTIAVNDVIQFTDLTQNDPTAWTWSISPGTIEFADGTTANAANPVVKFLGIGEYTITLTATNDLGSDTETKINYINVLDNPPSAEYCTPENLTNDIFSSIESINVSVQFYESGVNITAYQYFYDEPAAGFTQGETYQIVLTPVDGNRTRYFWRLWIDLNLDGDFFDDGELLFQANNKKGVVSGTITIPILPEPLSLTRMRVSLKKEAAQSDPCEDNFEGEVEDYNASILSPGDNTKSKPVAEKDPIQSISLQPNPLQSTHLNVNLSGYDQLVDAVVYDNHGLVVDRFEQATQQFELNTAGYNPGIYFIRFRTETGTVIKKFVKL